jgi:small subunit ribosomal protein S9
VTVNGSAISSYFDTDVRIERALLPLEVTGTAGSVDIRATVKGGGLMGQSEALSHGIAKALVRYDPVHHPTLRSLGLLTRDPRMVERKKPGRVKARKSPTWVKR